MSRNKISYREIIKSDINFSWEDIKYGLEKKYISLFDVVKLAEHNFSHQRTDELTLEISELLSDDYEKVEKIFEKLKFRNNAEQNLSVRKWLFCYLSSLFNLELSLDDKLDSIETIYSDFDYPEEISGMVRYMPIGETFKSQKEYTNEIESKWTKYLNSEKVFLSEINN